MLTSKIKENNIPLEENEHVDENEPSGEWKLPYKRLR